MASRHVTIACWSLGLLVALPLRIASQEPPPCDAPFQLGFSLRRVQSAAPWDGTLGPTLGVGCGRGRAVLGLGGDVFVDVVQQEPGDERVEAWSLSVALDGGDYELAGATTDTTAGAPDPVGLRGEGFEVTELIDPDANGGQQGCVSVVILSLSEDIELPSGTQSVLRVTLAAREGAAGFGRLAFRHGLRGAAEPVRNALTVGGRSAHIANLETAALDIVPAAADSRPFVRADSNADGRVDISDAGNTLGVLFLGTGAISCESAADANADRRVDIADAAFTLGYLFLGGDRPHAPFIACGLGADGELSCAAFAPCE